MLFLLSDSFSVAAKKYLAFALVPNSKVHSAFVHSQLQPRFAQTAINTFLFLLVQVESIVLLVSTSNSMGSH